MHFSIEFYESSTGSCPVRDFLVSLEKSDPDDHAAVIAGLVKMRDRRYHREPLTKQVGDGLFELRHLGKLNTRILWFFMKGQRIILVHGIRNKGQKIDTIDLNLARQRMQDWLKRSANR